MAEKKATILMRVNIVGYAGPPSTLFCAFDPNTDILAVVKEAPEYEPGARDGFLKISSQSRDTHYDALFTEDNTRDAINAFFELDALKLINISAKAQRCNPTAKIERDGMDEGGMKYRISPDITNAQVGVLAASHFAGSQRGVAAVADFMEDMRMLSI
jgi:hypothetical protein